MNIHDQVTQESTPRYSGLVDNSYSEEISEVTVYDIGTKLEVLGIKITKYALCDGKYCIELLLSLHMYQCQNITLYSF